MVLCLDGQKRLSSAPHFRAITGSHEVFYSSGSISSVKAVGHDIAFHKEIYFES